MARGVISDSHQLNGGASRSLVLKESDVVFCIGSRLSWQLHFGDSPKFDSNCKFILALSAECSSDNPVENSALKIIGDISKTVTYISNAMHERATIDESVKAEREVWVERVKSSCTNSINKLEGVRSKALEIYRNASSPMLGFHVAMTVIRNALNSLQDTDCFIVSEGANTMDFGRILLPAPIIPRRRLDAGYWGTMVFVKRHNEFSN
jgi:2-hydroxyacyl-CoA lyase 1